MNMIKVSLLSISLIKKKIEFYHCYTVSTCHAVDANFKLSKFISLISKALLKS